jgi:hypothetical protein
MMTNVGDAFRAKVQSSYTATRMATKILMSGCKSYIGHRLREALLLPDLLQPRRSTARSVMFLPSSAKSGSSLLRAENVALALRRQGWRTMTIPPQLALSQRRRMVRLFNPDILVFQQCRHPLNDVGHAFAKPFVLEPRFRSSPATRSITRCFSRPRAASSRTALKIGCRGPSGCLLRQRRAIRWPMRPSCGFKKS